MTGSALTRALIWPPGPRSPGSGCGSLSARGRQLGGEAGQQGRRDRRVRRLDQLARHREPAHTRGGGTRPLASSARRWKTVLAMSRPIMVVVPAGGSLCWSVWLRPSWRTDAVGGPSTQHGRDTPGHDALRQIHLPRPLVPMPMSMPRLDDTPSPAGQKLRRWYRGRSTAHDHLSRFVWSVERWLGGWFQYMCCPPLIDKVDPVMNPASSAVRNATPRAISSA